MLALHVRLTEHPSPARGQKTTPGTPFEGPGRWRLSRFARPAKRRARYPQPHEQGGKRVKTTAERCGAQGLSKVLRRDFRKRNKRQGLLELEKEEERRRIELEIERAVITTVDRLTPLEVRTKDFRLKHARRHLDKRRDAKKRYDAARERWEADLERTGGRHAAEPSFVVSENAVRDCYDSVDDFYTFQPDDLRDEMATIRWHEHRATGQRKRFRRIRSCGAQMRIATCRGCASEGKAVPEGCGVTRVCKRCQDYRAGQRRARFGRARASLLRDAARRHLFKKDRAFGRFGEKLLTLTIPHVTRGECVGKRLREAPSEVACRIDGLFAAWPIFLRIFRKVFRQLGIEPPTVHRSFEWTPGNDGQGHPHFHCYMFSPFVPHRQDGAIGRAEFEARKGPLRVMLKTPEGRLIRYNPKKSAHRFGRLVIAGCLRDTWAFALESAGVPIRFDEAGAPILATDLQSLSFEPRAVREVMKGGKGWRTQAITLSRIGTKRRSPAELAFDYAEGWNLASVGDGEIDHDTRADLYMALEGRRLTQASREFYLKDEPPACTCCGSIAFYCRFEPREGWRPGWSLATPNEERGPPPS